LINLPYLSHSFKYGNIFDEVKQSGFLIFFKSLNYFLLQEELRGY